MVMKKYVKEFFNERVNLFFSYSAFRSNKSAFNLLKTVKLG